MYMYIATLHYGLMMNFQAMQCMWLTNSLNNDTLEQTSTTRKEFAPSADSVSPTVYLGGHLGGQTF